jgi:phosphoribosylformylglycinamidine synthase
MKTVWEEGGVHKEVTAPASLVVSAFAPVEDARKTLTPQLQAGGEPTKLILIDLGIGKNRLGASALAQVYKQTGNTVPDVDDPGKLKAFFQVIQSLLQSDVLLAYHDRSDGGVLVTLCEMMFASHKGLTVTLDPLVGRDDVQACMEALFNEELGAVVQIRTQDEPKVLSLMREAGLGADVFEVAALNEEDNLVILYRGQEIFKQTRVLLQRIWSETTFHMQKLRDNPDCAQQEFDSILDTEDAGLHAALSFDPDEKPDAPYVNAKTKPRIAILREQGVNGHVEMAAAFDRAGFEAVDVHMSDILNGDHSLKDFKGMAACGGFSYGDVLGAGEGWAKSILFNPRAREEFEAFFARPDSFAL